MKAVWTYLFTHYGCIFAQQQPALLTILLTILVLILPAAGQDKARVSKWDVEVLEAVSDGTPLKPVVKPSPARFKVISSRTKMMDVLGEAEMPGISPMKGRANVTVQMVEEPVFSAPPVFSVPLPALKVDDPAVLGRLAELQEKYQSTALVFISATVYDHKRTLLRIHSIGADASEVSAWSNLDLNHFGGFSGYRVKDAVDGKLYDYGMLLGLGNEAASAFPSKIPKLPDLEKSGPVFAVLDGKAGSPAMDVLEQIHDLYRKDGTRMEADFRAREKALAERKAFLAANPPKPKDVTIRFWKRDSNTTTSTKRP